MVYDKGLELLMVELGKQEINEGFRGIVVNNLKREVENGVTDGEE
jgi:hypothetical protein